MFLNDGDLVAVNVLSCAARDVLEPIAKKKGMTSLREEFARSVPPEYEDDARQALANSYNFMKHSSFDADEVHDDFTPRIVRHFLLDCVVLYAKAVGKPSNEMRAYLVWLAYEEPGFFEGQPKPAEPLQALLAKFIQPGKDSRQAGLRLLAAFERRRLGPEEAVQT